MYYYYMYYYYYYYYYCCCYYYYYYIVPLLLRHLINFEGQEILGTDQSKRSKTAETQVQYWTKVELSQFLNHTFTD